MVGEVTLEGTPLISPCGPGAVTEEGTPFGLPLGPGAVTELGMPLKTTCAREGRESTSRADINARRNINHPPETATCNHKPSMRSLHRNRVDPGRHPHEVFYQFDDDAAPDHPDKL